MMAVSDGFHLPWYWLLESQLMALLALAFFIAAQHDCDKCFGWLLSSCVALGLAIAALYNFITAVDIVAISIAGVVWLISVGLFVVRQPLSHAHAADP